MQPIACNEREPSDYESVIFWPVPNQGNFPHDGIMIGEYDNRKWDINKQTFVYRFRTPHKSWIATHWCEIPEHLKNFKPNGQ